MNLHVTLTGCSTAPGGMMSLSPEPRQPVMALPRESTTKLTRKPAFLGGEARAEEGEEGSEVGDVGEATAVGGSSSFLPLLTLA